MKYVTWQLTRKFSINELLVDLCDGDSVFQPRNNNNNNNGLK